MFEIAFQYDEPTTKWEVIARGASSGTEALQGFNAVVMTAMEATPKVACNKAEPTGNPNEYKISVGVGL